MPRSPLKSVIEVLEHRTFFDGARFDAAFGSNGFTSFDQTGPYSEYLGAMAVTPSGQTLLSMSAGGPSLRRLTSGLAVDTAFAGGKIRPPASTSFTLIASDASGRALAVDNFSLRRYTASGAVDSSFGSGGIVGLPYNAIAIATSGDRVLTLNLTLNGGVTRYTANGQVDSSFAATPLPLDGGIAKSMAVDASGNVYVAAYFGADAKVFKLKSNGQFDTAFGSGGIATVKIAGPAGFSTSGVRLAPQIVGGKVTLLIDNDRINYTPQTAAPAVFVARLTATGRLDTSFSGDGIASVTRLGVIDDGQDIEVDPAGRVYVLAATGSNAAGYDSTVLRLTAGGNTDTAFDGDDRRTFGDDYFDFASSLALAADGTLRLAGLIGGRDGEFDLHVRKLSSTGATLAARTIAESGPTSAFITNLAAGASGDVYGLVSASGRPLQMVHVLANGKLDTAFGNSGALSFQPSDIVGYLNSSNYKITRLGNGKLLVAGFGSKTPQDLADSWVFRVNANGTLDTSFGTNGLARFDFGGSDRFTSLLPTSDGGFVSASWTPGTATSPTAAVFARVRANGTLDTSFGVSGKRTVTGMTLPFVEQMFLSGSQIVAFGMSDGRRFVTRLSTSGQVLSAPKFVSADSAQVVASSVARRGSGFVTMFIRQLDGPPYSEYSVALLDANGVLIGSPKVVRNLTLDEPAIIATRPDGRIMSVSTQGTYSSMPSAEVRMTMFKSDGTIDSSFGTGGQVTLKRTPTASGSLSFRQMVFTPTFDVVVAGSETLYNSARLSDAAFLKIDVDPTNTTAVTGSISGYAFNDSDKDGVFDSSETKAGGKTVFVDADNDGKLDAGEKQVTTASDGSYKFTGLTAGTYHVRRVFPSGFTYSTKLIDLVLSSGQNVTGTTIGSRAI